eukprot:6175317-Pleurochrysis_carterae.AAC.3
MLTCCSSHATWANWLARAFSFVMRERAAPPQGSGEGCHPFCALAATCRDKLVPVCCDVWDNEELDAIDWSNRESKRKTIESSMYNGYTS